MALNAKVGSFLTGTAAAGGTVTVTGVGFTPSVAIFWWDGSTGTPPVAGRATNRLGMGWALSPSARRAMGTTSEDNQATSVTRNGQRDDSCVMVNASGTNAADGRLDLNAFNSDGFVLDIDDAFTQSYRINYLVLGGSDITNSFTGTFLTNAVTGAQSITGVGFQPNFLLMMTTRNATAPPNHGNVNVFSVGAAIGANQFTIMGQDANGQAAGTAHSYAQAGEILAGTSSAGTAITNRVSFTSFDADGFTVNVLETNAQMQVFYLALAGVRAAITTVNTRTDTNNISVTGVGVGTPVAAMFFSTNRALSAADTGDDNDTLSIGAASSTTQRAAVHTLAVNAADPTQNAKALRDDAVYARVDTSTFAINALMDLVSFDADGLTCVMDDADTVASAVKVIAFGQSTTTPTIATATDPVTPGSSATITGSGFGAVQGTVTINGVSQTVTAWSDTSITITVLLGNNRYGVDYSLVVTTNGALTATRTGIDYVVPSGVLYTNLEAPLAGVDVRLSSETDLNASCQIEWSNVLSGLVAQSVSNVFVYNDGSFSAQPTMTSFAFRVHDGTEWGSYGTQFLSLNIPIPEAPVSLRTINCA